MIQFSHKRKLHYSRSVGSKPFQSRNGATFYFSYHQSNLERSYFLNVGKILYWTIMSFVLHVPSNAAVFIQRDCTRLHMTVQLLLVSKVHGRAIAQAVSRWLPTAAARVQTRV
jgi:hypothetical protein